MRILYAEDNEVNQALVERVVRAKRYSIVFREEGEEALEVLAEDPTIDLILLDIELAGAISGLEVIRTMRARNDHRPVVAITAYAMMGDRERILNAGCDQYLPKPLVITDLLNLLEHYEAEIEARAHAPAQAAASSAVPAPAADGPQAAADSEPEAAEPAQPAPSADGMTATPPELAATPGAEEPGTPAAPAAAPPESIGAEPVEAGTSAAQPEAAPAASPATQASKNGTPEAVPEPQKAPTGPPSSPVPQDELAKDSLV